MPEGEKLAHELKSTGSGTLREILRFVIDYVGPILLFLVGVLEVGKLGGSATVYGFLTGSAHLSDGLSAHAPPLVPAAIWGAFGGAMWSFGSHDGMIQRLVGRFTGSFFLGAMVGALIWAVIPPTTFPNGLIDTAFAALQGGA